VKIKSVESDECETIQHKNSNEFRIKFDELNYDNKFQDSSTKKDEKLDSNFSISISRSPKLNHFII
jgi:hypothetical protein